MKVKSWNELDRWAVGESVIRDVILPRGISLHSLEGTSRRRHLVSARREVVKRLWKMEFKLETIGLLLGGRDHTTIMHLRDTEDPE